MESTRPDVAAIAREVMAWKESIPALTYVNAGRVAEIKPSIAIGKRWATLFALSGEGKLFFGFATWNNHPVLGDTDARVRLVGEINAILGTSLSRTEGWPSIQTTALVDPIKRAQFLEVFRQLIDRVSVELRITPIQT